jgi:hypothetical protein
MGPSTAYERGTTAMTRSKTFVVGTAVVAGAFAATIALSGSASAGGPSNATYSCQSITPSPSGPIVNNFPSVSSQFSTAAGKIKMIAILAPGIPIASNTINTTIKLNSSGGPVTYATTTPTNLPSAPGGPVNVGPVPLASGTPSGTLTVPIGSGTPGPLNWSVHLVHVPTTTDIYCIGLTPFTPPLTP